MAIHKDASYPPIPKPLPLPPKRPPKRPPTPPPPPKKQGAPMTEGKARIREASKAVGVAAAGAGTGYAATSLTGLTPIGAVGGGLVSEQRPVLSEPPLVRWSA